MVFFAEIVNRALFKVTKFNNTCAQSTDLDRTLWRVISPPGVAEFAHLKFCLDSGSAGTIGTLISIGAQRVWN